MTEPIGGQPPKIDDSQRLTFSDLGADLKSIMKENSNIEPDQQDSEIEGMATVTDLDEYRQQKTSNEAPGSSADESFEIADDQEPDGNYLAPSVSARPAKKKKGKKVAAVAMSGLATIGMVKSAIDGYSALPEPVTASSTETPLEIDTIKVGAELAVSQFSYIMNGGNIRTSPKVVDDNLLAHTDFTGQTIIRPIEVDDESNSKNGYWLEFVDSKGNVLYTNSQNVEAIENDPKSDILKLPIHVTVTKTSNHGIFASDGKGGVMRVATVVESNLG